MPHPAAGTSESRWSEADLELTADALARDFSSHSRARIMTVLHYCKGAVLTCEGRERLQRFAAELLRVVPRQ